MSDPRVKRFKVATPQRKKTGFLRLCKRGDLDKIKLYLEGDPSLINETDELGATGLMWAALSSHGETIQYLIESGADVLKEDADCRLASEYAKDPSVKEFLLSQEEHARESSEGRRSDPIKDEEYEFITEGDEGFTEVLAGELSGILDMTDIDEASDWQQLLKGHMQKLAEDVRAIEKAKRDLQKEVKYLEKQKSLLQKDGPISRRAIEDYVREGQLIDEDHIEALRKQEASLSSSIEERKNDLASIELVKSELESRIHELKEEQACLLDDINHQKKEFEDAKVQSGDLYREFTLKSREKQEIEETIGILRTESKDLMEEVQLQTEDREAMSADLFDIRSEIDILTDERMKLTKNVDLLKEEEEKVSKELAGMKEELRHGQMKLDSLTARHEAELSNHEERVRQSIAQQSQLETLIASLKEKSEAGKISFHEISQRVTDVTNQLQIMEKKSTEQSKVLQDVVDEYEKAVIKERELSAKVQDFQRKKRQLETMREEESEATKNLQSMKERVLDAEREISILAGQKENAIAEIRTLQRKIHSLEEELEARRKETESLHERKVDLEGSLEKHKSELAAAIKHRNDVVEEEKRCSAAIQAAKNDKKSLSQEIEKLRGDMKGSTKSLAELEDRIHKLQAQEADARRRVDEGEKCVHELKLAADGYEEQRKQREDDVNRLKRELQKADEAMRIQKKKDRTTAQMTFVSGVIFLILSITVWWLSG